MPILTCCPRYLTGAGQSSDASFVAAAEALGLEPLEPDYLADEREAHSLLPPWPILAAACPGQESVGTAAAVCLPHMLLGCFASEGDNVPHAMEVARCSLSLLGLVVGDPGDVSAPPGRGPAPLRTPCSFAALYGRSSGMDSFLG